MPEGRPIRFITNSENFIIWSSNMNLQHMTKAQLIKQIRELTDRKERTVQLSVFERELDRRKELEVEVKNSASSATVWKVR